MTRAIKERFNNKPYLSFSTSKIKDSKECEESVWRAWFSKEYVLFQFNSIQGKILSEFVLQAITVTLYLGCSKENPFFVFTFWLFRNINLTNNYRIESLENNMKKSLRCLVTKISNTIILAIQFCMLCYAASSSNISKLWKKSQNVFKSLLFL